jgi:hypothetical protein
MSLSIVCADAGAHILNYLTRMEAYEFTSKSGNLKIVGWFVAFYGKDSVIGHRDGYRKFLEDDSRELCMSAKQLTLGQLPSDLSRKRLEFCGKDTDEFVEHPRWFPIEVINTRQITVVILDQVRITSLSSFDGMGIEKLVLNYCDFDAKDQTCPRLPNLKMLEFRKRKCFATNAVFIDDFSKMGNLEHALFDGVRLQGSYSICGSKLQFLEIDNCVSEHYGGYRELPETLLEYTVVNLTVDSPYYWNVSKCFGSCLNKGLKKLTIANMDLTEQTIPRTSVKELVIKNSAVLRCMEIGEGLEKFTMRNNAYAITCNNEGRPFEIYTRSPSCKMDIDFEACIKKM